MLTSRLADMSHVANARVHIEENPATMEIVARYSRSTIYGNLTCGWRLGEHVRDGMSRADEREYMLMASRAAGRKLDAEFEKLKKIHSARTGISDPGLLRGMSASSIYYDEAADLPAMPREKAKEPAKVASPKAKDDKMSSGYTASETYDMIVACLSAVNQELMTHPEVIEYISEMWMQVRADDFSETPLVSDEAFRFEKIIYSDRLDAILAVVRPVEGGKNIMLRATELEDAFPELAHDIDRPISFSSAPWSSMRELDKAVQELTKGRATFRKSLSEASYGALAEATAKKVVKKQTEAADFYAANPIYGTL